MSANHGNTPAAWTAVTIALAGFVIAAIGLMLYNMPTFWVGVACAPVAIIAGVVMSRMGYGASN